MERNCLVLLATLAYQRLDRLKYEKKDSASSMYLQYFVKFFVIVTCDNVEKGSRVDKKGGVTSHHVMSNHFTEAHLLRCLYLEIHNDTQTKL